MSADDERDQLDDAVARHYARQAEGLPSPCEPHPGYATLGEAIIAHRRWLWTTTRHSGLKLAQSRRQHESNGGSHA